MNDDFNLYQDDDQEIVATVEIDGRPIKLKGSAEFRAFIESVMLLAPEAKFQQAVWLEQMSYFLEAGVPGETRVLNICDRTIVPSATEEAFLFLESLYDLENAPRRATAILLRTFAKQFFIIATNDDPSLLFADIGS